MRASSTVGQWKPTMFKDKNGLGQKFWVTINQSIKAILGWILGTRPHPWAWGATNVPYPLGSTHGLG